MQVVSTSAVKIQDYAIIGDGGAAPKIKNAAARGWRADMAAELLTLRSAVDLEQASAGWIAKFVLKTGEPASFSLTFSEEGPGVLPPLGDSIGERLNLTID